MSFSREEYIIRNSFDDVLCNKKNDFSEIHPKREDEEKYISEAKLSTNKKVLNVQVKSSLKL